MVKGHLNRIVRPPNYLQAFTQHQLSVSTYALHISEDGIDFPPEWILQSAAVIDTDDVAWPMVSDKTLNNVWSCTILGDKLPAEQTKLSLEFRDLWTVRLTEAQREEMGVKDPVMKKSEFNERLCNLIANQPQGRSSRFFERLFIEPTPPQTILLSESHLVHQNEKIQNWEIDLGPPTPAIQIALDHPKP